MYVNAENIIDKIEMYMHKSSLVDQTAPFPSTGCIASPARGREGLATLARFAWPISECGDDQ